MNKSLKYILLVIVCFAAIYGGIRYYQQAQIAVLADKLREMNYDDRYLSTDTLAIFLCNDAEKNLPLVKRQQTAFINATLGLNESALQSRSTGDTTAARLKSKVIQAVGTFFSKELQDSFLVNEYHYTSSLDSSTLQIRQQARSLFRGHYFEKDSLAIPLFRQTLAMLEEIGAEKVGITILKELQDRFYRINMTDTSLSYGFKALDKAQKINHRIMMCQLFRALGNDFFKLENYQEAIHYYDQGLAVADGLNDRSEAMKLNSRKANSLSKLPHHEQLALQAYLKAIELGSAIGDTDYLRPMYYDRGILYNNMSLFDDAEKDFLQSIEVNRDSVNKTRAYANAGIFYANIGKFAEALTFQFQAKRYLPEAHNITQANIWDNIGDIYLQLAVLDSAFFYYDKSLASLDIYSESGKLKPTALQMDILIGIGNTYLNQADQCAHDDNIPGQATALEKARDKFLTAIDLPQVNGIELPRETARALIGMGRFHHKQNEYHLALNRLREAMQIAENFQAPQIVMEAYFDIFNLYNDQQMDEAAENALAKVIEIVEASRNNVSGSNQLSFFAQLQDIYNAMILFLSERGRYAEAFEYSENSRARALLDIIRQKNLWQANDRQADGIAGIQASLREKDVQLIEYKVTRNKLLIFVMTGERANVAPVVLDISREHLENLIKEYRQTIGADENDAFESQIKIDPESVYQRGQKMAEELYGILIQPATPLLDPAKQLYIIPDEILCYVPFAALQNPEVPGRFLIEDYTIAYSPSAYVLKYILDYPIEAVSGATDRFFGIANPTFDLPATEEEIRSCASYFQNKPYKPYLKSYEVTEIRTREALLEKPAVIQFSTHANTDSDNSDYHAIVVGRAEDDEQSESEINSILRSNEEIAVNDEYLTVREIADLDLVGVKFVNLPGCNTGGGVLYRGEGVVGITSAFMKAGAPSVMSTLWNIYDQESQTLMIDFFRHWMRGDNIGKATALQQAQKSMIKKMRNNSDYPFPQRWAAFVINGESF